MLDDLNAAFTDATLRALAPIGDARRRSCVALKARGLRLGLATNDGEASARRQLAALGLDAHMDFIAGYDTGHGGKPDPGMVLAFAAPARGRAGPRRPWWATAPSTSSRPGPPGRSRWRC